MKYKSSPQLIFVREPLTRLPLPILAVKSPLLFVVEFWVSENTVVPLIELFNILNLIPTDWLTTNALDAFSYHCLITN